MTTTRLSLVRDDVSVLLGLVRSAIDEADEILDEGRGVDDDEDRAWQRERRQRCARLERRLTAAGRRLTGEAF